MIGTIRIKRPNLILLYCLNRRDKLVRTSVMEIGIDINREEKKAKNDEIILILLVTIFMLFFFARTLESFLVLFFSALAIGIFGLIKNYERRK